jgi:hypothetical protein
MWFCRRRFLNDPTQILHFCDYLPFEEDLALYLNKLDLPSPKDNLYQGWLDLAGWFWKKRFLKNFQCIFTLALLSPLGEGLSPFFEQTWISFTQGWFVPSLVKIGQVVLEKKIIKWSHPIFTFLWLSPLWRGPGPLIYLHPRTICTKFDWIWWAGSGEDF